MAGSLLYVNARIKSLENSLLNSMQLSRLVDAENLSDAFKILQECGYGAGLAIDDINSYENLIKSEEHAAIEFLRENLFKNSGLEAFLLKNDYHNAKVLIKAKYLRLDKVDDMVASDGLISIDLMKEEIKNDKYDKLPRLMANALGAIDVAFVNDNRSPRMIDILLDKAMFNDIYVTIKASGQKPLQDYFTAWVDTTNIASFIRSKRLGLESKFFNEVFVDNGSLRRELFSDLYDASIEQFKEKTKYTPYGALVNKAVEDENGLVKFETAVDNYLIDIFKNSKYDMFSVAPIAGYYVGQVTEIKVVKLVISCIKNNVDKQLLKQRLRELYA